MKLNEINTSINELGISCDEMKKSRYAELRYDYKMDRMQVGQMLIDAAERMKFGISLESTIYALIKDEAYDNAKLSFAEFVRKTKKIGLSQILLDKYLESLLNSKKRETMDGFSQDMVKEQLKMARAEMNEFIESDKRIFALERFLKSLRLRFPLITRSAIFTESMIERLEKKVEAEIYKTAEEIYSNKFSRSPRDFVMDYLMGRVFVVGEDRKLYFNRKSFIDLLRSLENLGVDLESINDGGDFYDWLVEEVICYVGLSEIDNERINSRMKIEDVIDEEDMDDENIALSEYFDVDEFYRKHIAPCLASRTKARLAHYKKVREVDLMQITPASLSLSHESEHHLRFVKELADLAENFPEKFNAWLKATLGYEWSPRARHVSENEFREDVIKYFENVSTTIESIIDDALSFRGDVEIADACNFHPEILAVRDFETLFKWMAYPETFRSYLAERQFEGEQEIPDEKIRHECLVMMKMFMFYRKTLTMRSLETKAEEREDLEAKMEMALKIEDVKDVKVRFRILEPVDSKGRSLNPKSPEYKIVFDEINSHKDSFSDDRNIAKKLMSEHCEELVEYKRKKYKLYPIEEKQCFKEVTMSVPDVSRTENFGNIIKKIKVLIYSGSNQRFVNSKDLGSVILSLMRGKKISDLNRWGLVFENQEDKDAFVDFVYGIGAFGVVKVDDSDERRKIMKDIQPFFTSSTSKYFKSKQSFAGSFDVGMMEKHQDGLKYREMNFESQISTLSDKLIADVSIYTISSHERYRAKRAWERMWNVFFPSRIYGMKYWLLKRKGYDYKFNDAE
ncbi:hypothetical protein GF376_00230 [Candidatus Peregrinibacteria bacterium]|nr:hypothetical protein [Candidatus Peregrinibacteria bacterium]